MDLGRSGYRIGQNLYHHEWCPKYRYNMFRGKGNKKLCEEILHEVAERYNIWMIELSVMPDHIHTVVQLPPTMNVPQALHFMKTASFYELLRRQPLFRYRYARGSFFESRVILFECWRCRCNDCFGVHEKSTASIGNIPILF